MCRPHTSKPHTLSTSRRSAQLLAFLRYAAPNAVTLVRLLLLIHGVSHNEVQTCILSVFFAAVLDVLDGTVARWLDASSSFGAALDLVVDMLMWTALFGLAVFQASCGLRFLASLALALEWACSLSLLYLTLTKNNADWKGKIRGQCKNNSLLDWLTRYYLSAGMRNFPAFVSNVSHFTLPLSLYVLQGVHEPLTASAMAVGAIISLPGFLLYLYVTYRIFCAVLPILSCPPSPTLSYSSFLLSGVLDKVNVTTRLLLRGFVGGSLKSD